MKTLITGASGFLGGRLAEAMSRGGRRVTGMVRDASRWTNKPEEAEIFVGDVTDAASVGRAAEGCEVIVHGAALVKSWVRDRREFDRVNVEGLGHAIEAARRNGAKLIYVSSFIALGPTDGEVFDEETPRRSTEFHNDYERTKWLADQMARRIDTTDVDLVRVYPGVIFGPGALTQGNHVVQLLLQHARGKLPGMLGGGDLPQCFAYVDDVVAGIVGAVESAKPGSGYILGGENRTAIDLFAAFEQATGIAPPTRRLPFALASFIGKLQRWRAELFGVEPELTDEVVGIYRHEWAYSSERAERDLGYRITPFDRAIGQTVDWLKTTGELAG